MTESLPACPFCGCAGIITVERKIGGKPFRALFWMETVCKGCGANTTGDTATESETKWRRRVS